MAASKPQPSRCGSDARQCMTEECDRMRHGDATRNVGTGHVDATAAINTGEVVQNISTTELATPKEAAKYLRTTVGKLANDRHHGVGPAYAKYGRSVLYPWDALRAFVDDCMIGDG
ncbi:hypothetical protein AB0H58_02545 [Nocardia neocaledoniensis]|uniref:hypothetical protein n=1 Tax=Nocardia neocaledoniensis TaxID=236511 RepID=UPI0033D68B91